jgi:DNA-nicking Smr family endonuclease
MARSRALSPDEAQLFRDTLHDAKPLRQSKKAKSPPPTAKPAAAKSGTVRVPRPQPEPAPRASQPPLAPGPTAGIDRRTHDRFKKGEMAIDARLDLHGLTQTAAHDALLRFVDRGVAAGHRCLLVVTGKGLREGTGVLRAQVPRWLNEAALRPHLLAVHTARPQHGGEGALYVLLKRKR